MAEFPAITADAIRAALQQHNTIFFDGRLNPVKPQVGQWFCEFHIDDSDEEVLAEAIVQYLGKSESAYLVDGQWVPFTEVRVADDYAESDRCPYGDVLILQH